MIQFNLLPDVKLEHIKAERSKRVVILAAVGVSGTLLGIVVLLFIAVNGVQAKYLSDLSSDIKRDSQTLQDTPDLTKVLTIQNQLNKLPELHNGKPVVSRLFGYLSQITPNQLSIASLDVDFDQSTLSFQGGADAISTINKFVDTLKFTQYRDTQASTDPANDVQAFSDVVLSSFGRDEQGATYQIQVKFDSAIFDSSKRVELIVPNIITTRSETEKPKALFQPGGANQEPAQGVQP